MITIRKSTSKNRYLDQIGAKTDLCCNFPLQIIPRMRALLIIIHHKFSFAITFVGSCSVYVSLEKRKPLLNYACKTEDWCWVKKGNMLQGQEPTTGPKQRHIRLKLLVCTTARYTCSVLEALWKLFRFNLAVTFLWKRIQVSKIRNTSVKTSKMFGFYIFIIFTRYFRRFHEETFTVLCAR